MALVVVLCAVLGSVFAFSRQERYESSAKISITPDVDSRRASFPRKTHHSAWDYAEAAESRRFAPRRRRSSNAPRTPTSPRPRGIRDPRDQRSRRSPGPRERRPRPSRGIRGRTPERSSWTLRSSIPRKLPEDAGPTAAAADHRHLDHRWARRGRAARLGDRPPRRRIETSDDLAEVTNLPLLAQVPRNRALARRKGSEARLGRPRSVRPAGDLPIVPDESRVRGRRKAPSDPGHQRRRRRRQDDRRGERRGRVRADGREDRDRRRRPAAAGAASGLRRGQPTMGAEPGVGRSGQRARDTHSRTSLCSPPDRPSGIRRAFCTSPSAA